MSNLPSILSKDELTQIQTLVGVFIQSGAFPDTKNAAQGIVKIIAGAELGIPPFQAMRDLSFVQGKLTMAGAAIAARIKTSGVYDYEPVTFTESACVLRFTKNGKAIPPDISFTLEDARRLGLAGKDNYQKQARTMLFWRAVTMGARMHCPHLFNGPIYTPDEISSGVANENLPQAALSNPFEATDLPAPIPAQNGANKTASPAITAEVIADNIVLLDNPLDHIIQGDVQSHGARLGDIPIYMLRKVLRSKRFDGKLTPSDKANMAAAIAAHDKDIDRIKADRLARQADETTFENDSVPDFSEGSSE